MKNYHRYSRVGLIVVLSFVFLFAGMARANDELKPTGEPIVIGSALPLTGPSEILGTDMGRGVSLAVEEINEAGGIMGRPLKVIREDTQNKPKEGINAAHKLVEVNDVSLMIAAYSSGVTLPIAEYTNRKGVVQINPGATTPKLEDVGPYLFSVIGLDILMGKQNAKFAMEDTGQKKFSILVPNNPYGIGVAIWMRKAVEEAGGEILSEIRYERFKNDYRAELRELYKPDPPAILYSAYGKESRILAKQAYELGFDTSNWYGAYADMCTNAPPPETVDGVKGLIPTAEGPRSDLLQQRYIEKYNEEPQTSWHAYTYDATWLAAIAMNFANSTDPDKIKEALHKISGIYKGASGGGDKSFDEEGMQVIETYKPVIYSVEEEHTIPYEE